MLRIICLIFLLPLASFYIHAQTDSTYISSYGDVFSVRAYFAKDVLNVIMDSDDRPEESGSYVPNNPPKLGLGFSINNTIISLSYGRSFNFMKDKTRSKTKSFDFQLHNYSRKLVFDLYLQRYKGFDWEDDKGKNIRNCPDLKVSQYGASLQYIFNNRKFSYKAAFVHNERQLKSAGTFLAGISLYKSKIESDSSFTYTDKHLFDNIQLGLSGGYAYTWIMGRHWYATGAITAGVGLGYEKLDNIGKAKLEVSPTVTSRVAVGYNHDSWAFGAYYVGNVVFPSMLNDRSIGIHSGQVQLFAIKRFYKIPFLRK